MSSSGADELVALRDKIRRLDYSNMVEGKEIYNYFGGRVLEQTTTTGKVVAVKFRDPGTVDRSEAEMSKWLSSYNLISFLLWIPYFFGLYIPKIRC